MPPLAARVYKERNSQVIFIISLFRCLFYHGQEFIRSGIYYEQEVRQLIYSAV